MRLIFATNNLHKKEEIKRILGERYKDLVLFVDDFNVSINPDENGSTFKENASIKSKALYYELKSKNLLIENDYIFSDDSGLCIDALDGAPGVLSARFMGEKTPNEEKNKKIIEIMKDLPDDKRSAYFITVLSVMHIGPNDKVKELFFEGKVGGFITKNLDGNDGFGYDPIFAVGDLDSFSNGNAQTYAKMGKNEKNRVSHRAKAISNFVDYLEKYHNI